MQVFAAMGDLLVSVMVTESEVEEQRILILRYDETFRQHGMYHYISSILILVMVEAF